MRILSTKQVKELDAWTIEHEPIASIELMERASRAFVDWFTLRISAGEKVAIVCGTGNNGGDGLAIARMLHEWGYPVKAYILRGGVAATPDFELNRQRLPEKIECRELTKESDDLALEDCDVIVDAIFGSGLSRPPEGLYASAINRINKAEAVRIAVDIPSGLMADAHSPGISVRADYTVSFQLPKLAFMLPEAHTFTGEWVVIDIGLDKKFIRKAPTPFYYTRLKDIQKIIRPREKFDHKGTYGHALLVVGSFGKMGAAVLSARAALRAGVGLLSVHVPRCGYSILQTAVPEAMSQVDNDEAVFTGPPDLSPYSTIGIGPGLGQDRKTVQGLEKTLRDFGKAVVLDADALNILGTHRNLLQAVPPGSILTPHPREFERLTGKWKNDFERLEMQRQLAVSLKSAVVLKGAHTSVAGENGDVYFNSTGNPGMATGGTGDVLTGIVTGLLAQNYTPIEAAVAGVYLHGLAGDIVASEGAMESLIASDLIERLPAAFGKVGGKQYLQDF